MEMEYIFLIYVEKHKETKNSVPENSFHVAFY